MEKKGRTLISAKSGFFFGSGFFAAVDVGCVSCCFTFALLSCFFVSATMAAAIFSFNGCSAFVTAISLLFSFGKDFSSSLLFAVSPIVASVICMVVFLLVRLVMVLFFLKAVFVSFA